ncbi:MAG: NUDIX domain-containing protein [Meiothermus sp.]|uniref:NUDIX domain-containing protein n=1 Tax=Meiothermus sp. TaxID=1955249 RepID=UPI0025FFCDAF|nr:NUDIX domain-containing protein [Meiothermus sp.]MCS7059336.1 NUDIX domain-containing protein [Meiothermus sp.]MCS7194328.1 NUDIX domain-containing protein [Meiothermus sp.]MCX7740753.1 NUDIX domain-containing protein [Meiothermus sp.]MDW8090505.1 NUDIX domain-containing protein [Meiothermus sp.]MDW8482156.1 NUDIX domain-containing protein [Meiothermus sp.]
MERVYVLPASAFPPAGDGLMPLEPGLLKKIEREGFFLERTQAEEDPSYRQVIPYALVRYGDRYLLMRRKGGNEARLRGLYTLGVGGHINPEDQGVNPLLDGLRRELLEEVGVRRYTARPMGLIVMSDTPVSRVHAGVVFLVDSEDQPQVAEPEKLEGWLATPEEVHAVYDRLEGWSQVVVDRLRGQQGLEGAGSPWHASGSAG